jgi:hypothetical protein
VGGAVQEFSFSSALDSSERSPSSFFLVFGMGLFLISMGGAEVESRDPGRALTLAGDSALTTGSGSESEERASSRASALGGVLAWRLAEGRVFGT